MRKARLVRRLGPLQERERICANPLRRRPQRAGNVRPERRGIVVAMVEREPRHEPSIGSSGWQPLRQQRRLTEPGRSRHQRQRRLRRAAQALAQSRTRTRPRRRLGTWSLVSSSGPAMTTVPQEPVFTGRQPRTRCQPNNSWLTKRVVRAGHPRSSVTCGSTVRGILADPSRRFPAVSAYRSICTSNDRAEGMLPPRTAPGLRAHLRRGSIRQDEGPTICTWPMTSGWPGGLRLPSGGCGVGVNHG